MRRREPDQRLRPSRRLLAPEGSTLAWRSWLARHDPHFEPTCEDLAVQQRDAERREVRFLVFSASLRAESLNTRLADLAAACLEANAGIVDRAFMREFDCPSYNFDVQSGDGFPAGADELHRRLQACDGFVVASPEYNASLPGLLKNAIDWVSRYEPQPFNERHGLLLSASPSMVGGNRGLWALRIPFEHLGARIYPDMLWRTVIRTALLPKQPRRRPVRYPGYRAAPHKDLLVP